MTSLSDAQLTQIADCIFAMGDRSKTRLPKPANTGPPSFTSKLQWIGEDPDFQDAGIGVIDFTTTPMTPQVWLHNGDAPFRIGSATKVAILLAAVQLRLDVRRILKLQPQVISTPAEFDEVFRSPALWRKAKAPWTEMRQIASQEGAPLISKILDFTKSPVDFLGPNPDNRLVRANQDQIFNKLPAADPELSWKDLPNFTFSERLWLTGCMSDNIAATACVSEIGVPYIKAVQRSYGLSDPAHGMHLQLSGGYAAIPGSSKPPDPKPPRQLIGVEPIRVTDVFWDRSTHGFTDNHSWVPGSAAALTAFMIALRTEALADQDPDALVPGAAARQTIESNMADGGPHAIMSFLTDGVDGHGGVRSITNIDRQIDKIGILRKKDGAKAPLLCEFVYLETRETTPPAAPARQKMSYAVVATGLTDSGGMGAAQKSEALGLAVHKALLSL